MSNFDYNVSGYGDNYKASAKKKAQELLGGQDSISIELFKNLNTPFGDLSKYSFFNNLDGDASSISVDELATVLYMADSIQGGNNDGKVSYNNLFTDDFDKLKNILANMDTSSSALYDGKRDEFTSLFNSMKQQDELGGSDLGKGLAQQANYDEKYAASYNGVTEITTQDVSSSINGASSDYMNALEGFSSEYHKDDTGYEIVGDIFGEETTEIAEKMILNMFKDYVDGDKIDGEFGTDISAGNDAWDAINRLVSVSNENNLDSGDEKLVAQMDEDYSTLVAIKDKVNNHLYGTTSSETKSEETKTESKSDKTATVTMGDFRKADEESVKASNVAKTESLEEEISTLNAKMKKANSIAEAQYINEQIKEKQTALDELKNSETTKESTLAIKEDESSTLTTSSASSKTNNEDGDYEIKTGDCLWTILTKKYGKCNMNMVNEVAKLNGITTEGKKAYIIYTGDTLTLPALDELNAA